MELIYMGFFGAGRKFDLSGYGQIFTAYPQLGCGLELCGFVRGWRQKKDGRRRRSGLLGARKRGDALGKTRNFSAREILVNYAVASGLHGRGFGGAKGFLSLFDIARRDRFFN